LCQITEYARKKASGNKLITEIQTNGAFNHDARLWMLDNMNIVWISFDGEPDVQNANRLFIDGSETSPVLEDNVLWFNANKGARNLMVGARVTITDMNIVRQKELVDYFASLGIRNIWTDPLFSEVGAVPVSENMEKKNTRKFDMDTYIEHFIEAHNYAKDFGINYLSFLACNFDGSTNQHCRTCTPTPHLTPDGYVSACDMVTFGKSANHMDCFVYGKWDSITESFKFDEKKISKLQKRCTENMLHCRDCKARHHCGGYCLGEVVNEVGDMYGQIPEVCRAIRKMHDIIKPPVETYEYSHP
jgi:radical SAM protein with 4Fe4S-binding SPASM domain